ncbi:MAG: Na/Pi cotransporter family protein [Ruminococcaceae bacterium]|nr:Na/Pi cotransporter family protein [Oscillospiraceae bacterium]
MEIISAIIQLLGGLAMFLYGIEVMGDGLKNSSGATLKKVLEKVTGNVIMGVLTGALVTAVIQSSTATIVLTVALIGAGVLNLKQAVSIVMGANIGTTITAQIIRLSDIEAGGNWFLWFFDTDTLAPIALVIGIILLMFVKKQKLKPIGDIAIGFGVLFVGLNLMTDGVKPLIGSSAFEAFLQFFTNPFAGILFGLVLTVIVQSSSATVGMLQTVASATAAAGGATITFAMAYPIIMGINLGTCVTTAMVCSIGSSKDAQRTGVVHIAFNTIGTILFLAVMTVMQHYAVFGAEFWSRTVDSGGIANFQTIFNLVTAIVLVPFTNVLVKLSMLIVKDEKKKPSRHPELETLDEHLYISPAIAVSEATKAVAAMGAIARDNFERASRMLNKLDDNVVKLINEDEDCLDQFKDTTDRFLIGLSKAVETEWDDRQVDMLLQTVPNFERVGDYATDLVELAERMQKANTSFSETAKRELALVSEAVNEILTITVDAVGRDDNEAAKAIEPLEETIDDMIMMLRDRHTKRLKSGACSIDSGLVFMETLVHMERASDQCSSIAVMMLARNNEEILQNHYDYLREIHAGSDDDFNAARAKRREQYIKPLKEIQ